MGLRLDFFNNNKGRTRDWTCVLCIMGAPEAVQNSVFDL